MRAEQGVGYGTEWVRYRQYDTEGCGKKGYEYSGSGTWVRVQLLRHVGMSTVGAACEYGYSGCVKGGKVMWRRQVGTVMWMR